MQEGYIKNTKAQVFCLHILTSPFDTTCLDHGNTCAADWFLKAAVVCNCA